MINRRKSILALFLLTAMLAACGESGSGTDTTVSSDTTAVPETTSPYEPETISISAEKPSASSGGRKIMSSARSRPAKSWTMRCMSAIGRWKSG